MQFSTQWVPIDLLCKTLFSTSSQITCAIERDLNAEGNRVETTGISNLGSDNKI